MTSSPWAETDVREMNRNEAALAHHLSLQEGDESKRCTGNGTMESQPIQQWRGGAHLSKCPELFEAIYMSLPRPLCLTFISLSAKPLKATGKKVSPFTIFLTFISTYP
jgi:hypothetical protein